MFVLDNLKNPGITIQGNQWQFFTDGVMGGVSTGKVKIVKINEIICYRMTGNVTTENNGGFIQMRVKINPSIPSNDYTGIYIKVYGNNLKYSIHLRTSWDNNVSYKNALNVIGNVTIESSPYVDLSENCLLDISGNLKAQKIRKLISNDFQILSISKKVFSATPTNSSRGPTICLSCYLRTSSREIIYALNALVRTHYVRNMYEICTTNERLTYENIWTTKSKTKTKYVQQLTNNE